MKSSIIHGPGTKKNFTTITPQGLPPDLIGNEDNLVERQNVLIEPKGYRYEAARLPPFKPFKTISDEDNIHLLPGFYLHCNNYCSTILIVIVIPMDF